MKKNKLNQKGVGFKKREGELQVKIIDGSFKKIYEKEVGLNDKKGLKILALDLKRKGVDMSLPKKGEIPDHWW